MKTLWNKTSEKNRLLMSAAAIVCIAFIAYALAIRPTVQLYRHLESLNEQKAALQDSAAFSDGIGNSQKPLIATEPTLANAQTKLLYHLEQLTKRRNLRLQQIPLTELTTIEKKEVALITLKIEGKFSDQVGLVSHLEKTLSSIYLQSVNVEAVFDPRTRETRISNSLHFKTVIL